MSEAKPNKAGKYYHALTVAADLAKNAALKADLIELRDKLASGQLQWRGGAQCVPSQLKVKECP